MWYFVPVGHRQIKNKIEKNPAQQLNWYVSYRDCTYRGLFSACMRILLCQFQHVCTVPMLLQFIEGYIGITSDLHVTSWNFQLTDDWCFLSKGNKKCKFRAFLKYPQNSVTLNPWKPNNKYHTCVSYTEMMQSPLYPIYVPSFNPIYIAHLTLVLSLTAV